MRLVVLVIAGVLAGACGAAATTPAATQPAAGIPTGAILVAEGGVLRPLDNGGRVHLQQGWATVRFPTVPPKHETDLVVALFDARGTAAPGQVRAEFESLDMDHGITSVFASPYEGSHRIRLSFEMKGTWKIVVFISRSGVEETVKLVLPVAGGA